METCSGCGYSLRDSQVVESTDILYKSCPKCSSEAGRHVYYKYEDFGMRTMDDGRYIVQSWCPSCRSSEMPVTPPEFTC
ncbi:hypothetical protein Xvie_03941 [Xenorhabdus vietnamensis]|uniref:Uncharacterized protein n=1 Tax=Xenorhabdus vietnamensis TaxID=351656 RepID=A0A1Y2S8Z2_9GAMM|nr:hypothetical protein [Xenorhabdus vietnamensis]OTA14163.1 hypothetical protein Xvie_03941 [Xenorhabdus vietnamensis]